LSGQTAAGTDTNAEPPEQAVPDVVNVQLDLDFFSLSGSIPANTTYSFETGRQYGGDIFY
jgi:hypothetical protein